MKKVIWFCCVFFMYLNADDIEFNRELVGKVDKVAYSYDKKIKIIKRIGMEYCIKGNNFDKTQPNIMIMGWYRYKLGVPYGEDIIADLKPYIDNKATITDKTLLHHYQKSNFSRFYTCLNLYDSKEYQAEVERIVKKYCKDCK